MKRLVMVAAAGAMLGGCGSGSVDPNGLKLPSARYMKEPDSCGKTPKGAAGNRIMREHLADVKSACAHNRRTVYGLQGYARAITSKK